MKSNFLFVVLLCVLDSQAWGQSQEPVECDTNDLCVELVAQAQRQSKVGQLADAEKSYKRAYEASHDARLLFNIARVLDKRGQEPEAITYYRRFIEAPLSDEEQKAKARTYVEQLEAKVAARVVVPPAAPPAVGTPPKPEVEPPPSGEQNMAHVTGVPSLPSAMATSTNPAVEPARGYEQNGKPVYKKGWLWGVVLGSVAAVGLGVGLGLGLSQRTPPFPGDTNVYEPSF